MGNKIKVVDRNQKDFPVKDLLDVSKMSTAFVAAEKIHRNPLYICHINNGTYCIHQDGSVQETHLHVTYDDLMKMTKAAMECVVLVINEKNEKVNEYRFFPAEIIEIPLIKYAVISFTEPIHYMFIEHNGNCVAITPQQLRIK